MSAKLLIKTHNNHAYDLYKDHSTYNEGDSGLDLFVTEDATIPAQTTVFIDLMISCEMIQNDKNISYYLYPRSSMSKTPLRLANSVGIIDAGYRGNIKAAVDNISSEDYNIKKGDRLFQICHPTLSTFTFEISDELSTTQRGTGGFGSTGK